MTQAEGTGGVTPVRGWTTEKAVQAHEFLTYLLDRSYKPHLGGLLGSPPSGGVTAQKALEIPQLAEKLQKMSVSSEETKKKTESQENDDSENKVSLCRAVPDLFTFRPNARHGIFCCALPIAVLCQPQHSCSSSCR